MTWRQSAACFGTDSDLFFLERGASSRHAKAICAECPVVDECLDYAMNTYSLTDVGIFGGLTARERLTLRRRRQAQARRAMRRAS